MSAMLYHPNLDDFLAAVGALAGLVHAVVLLDKGNDTLGAEIISLVPCAHAIVLSC